MKPQEILAGIHQDDKIMEFLVEKSKNATSPVGIQVLIDEFVRVYGHYHSASTICTRFRSRANRLIHKIKGVTNVEKAKVLFLTSLPVNNMFMAELEKHALVQLDEDRRIIKYTAFNESVKLRGVHPKKGSIGKSSPVVQKHASPKKTDKKKTRPSKVMMEKEDGSEEDVASDDENVAPPPSKKPKREVVKSRWYRDISTDEESEVEEEMDNKRKDKTYWGKRKRGMDEEVTTPRRSSRRLAEKARGNATEDPGVVDKETRENDPEDPEPAETPGIISEATPKVKKIKETRDNAPTVPESPKRRGNELNRTVEDQANEDLDNDTYAEVDYEATRGNESSEDEEKDETRGNESEGSEDVGTPGNAQIEPKSVVTHENEQNPAVDEHMIAQEEAEQVLENLDYEMPRGNETDDEDTRENEQYYVANEHNIAHVDAEGAVPNADVFEEVDVAMAREKGQEKAQEEGEIDEARGNASEANKACEKGAEVVRAHNTQYAPEPTFTIGNGPRAVETGMTSENEPATPKSIISRGNASEATEKREKEAEVVKAHNTQYAPDQPATPKSIISHGNPSNTPKSAEQRAKNRKTVRFGEQDDVVVPHAYAFEEVDFERTHGNDPEFEENLRDEDTESVVLKDVKIEVEELRDVKMEDEYEEVVVPRPAKARRSVNRAGEAQEDGEDADNIVDPIRSRKHARRDARPRERAVEEHPAAPGVDQTPNTRGNMEAPEAEQDSEREQEPETPSRPMTRSQRKSMMEREKAQREAAEAPLPLPRAQAPSSSSSSSRNSGAPQRRVETTPPPRVDESTITRILQSSMSDLFAAMMPNQQTIPQGAPGEMMGIMQSFLDEQQRIAEMEEQREEKPPLPAPAAPIIVAQLGRPSSPLPRECGSQATITQFLEHIRSYLETITSPQFIPLIQNVDRIMRELDRNEPIRPNTLKMALETVISIVVPPEFS